MGTPPSKGKLLYHITHIDNMYSILQHGLLSRKELELRGIQGFKDIADPKIMKNREELSRYVLFHFFARNPFDGAVCGTYGSENMVIITITRDGYRENDYFVIPSHPLDSEKPCIYPYEEGIKHIKWDILDMKAGRDYRIPEIKKACMAECIMEYIIPPESFRLVYVYNEEAKQKLLTIPNNNVINIKVAPYMFR